MIISRYLTREVLTSLLGVTIILLLAFLSQQVVRYLNYVAVGKIPTSVLLQLVSFEVPYLLAILLPLGLLIGILLAFGRLHSNNEMAILQMYGYGNRRIFLLTSYIAIAISVFILWLMLSVNPWISEKRQHLMASDEATMHLVQTMMPGRFQVSSDGHHVMYVEKLSRDRKRAHNIFIAQEKLINDQAEWMLILANSGYQVKDKTTHEPFFVTTHGYRYEGIPGARNYKIIKFDKYALRVPRNDIHITHKENESLPTLQLWNDYSNPKRAAELQWRFSIAISAFVLALLALLFSSTTPRHAKYLALIPALLIYIIYINLLFISRRWLETGVLPIAIGMWWVHVAIIGLVILLALIRFKITIFAIANPFKRTRHNQS